MTWAPQYVTLDELKSFVRVDDVIDDIELGLVVEAASRAIDLQTNRQFGQVTPAEERFYTAIRDRRRNRCVVEIDDLMSEIGLAIESDGTTISDFTLLERNAAPKARPWTRIALEGTVDLSEGAVSVTAEWGWSEVPDTIRAATLLQASRLFKRRDAPFGVAGSPEMGNELRLLAQVDPDVAVTLKPFVRWWGAV